MILDKYLEQLAKLKQEADEYEDLKATAIESYRQLRDSQRWNKEATYINYAKCRENVVKYENKRDKVLSDIWQVEQQILGKYKIDSKKMCDLLQVVTNTKWQPKKLGGYLIEESEDYSDEKYINDAFYGVALVSENNELFDYNYLIAEELDTKSDSIILGQRETQRFSFVNDKVKQDVLDNFNWIHYYLYASARLPKISKRTAYGINENSSLWKKKVGNAVYYIDLAHNDSRVATLESIDYNSELIVKAIELYLENQRQHQQTNPGSEMGE